MPSPSLLLLTVDVWLAKLICLFIVALSWTLSVRYPKTCAQVRRSANFTLSISDIRILRLSSYTWFASISFCTASVSGGLVARTLSTYCKWQQEFNGYCKSLAVNYYEGHRNLTKAEHHVNHLANKLDERWIVSIESNRKRLCSMTNDEKWRWDEYDCHCYENWVTMNMPVINRKSDHEWRKKNYRKQDGMTKNHRNCVY